MKALIFYESEYGNTERVALAIGEALSEHGEIRVAPIEKVAGLGRHHTDLLVVGAPTQRHGLPAKTRDMLEGLPEGRLRDVAALAFDTRYERSRWLTGSAAKEIHRILQDLGCRPLAPPESFFVEGSEGPLEPGEEDRAGGWALHALGRPERAAQEDRS